jgi:hypothetical protein
MEVDASLQQRSFPAACKSYHLSLHVFVHLFSLGTGVCHFSAIFLANGGANGTNSAFMVNRHWVDEQGNDTYCDFPGGWSSCKVTICVNQPLPAADRQGKRAEEQV